MKTKMAAAVATAVITMLISVARGQTLILAGSLEAYLQPQALTEVFPNSGANAGTISSWVVNDPADDPSGYIFIYQLVNKGPDVIPHIELTGFSSSEVVLNGIGEYSATSGLTLPGAATPSAGGNFSNYSLTGSSALNFDGGSLVSGGTSVFLVVATNQKNIGDSYAQDQGDFTATGTILAPVPEPSSAMVLMAGLGCLFGVLKYRRIAFKR